MAMTIARPEDAGPRPCDADTDAAAKVWAVGGEVMLAIDLEACGRTALVLAYEGAGPASTPLILVAGGISANRHVCGHAHDRAPGWWEVQAPTLGGARWLAIDWVGISDELDVPITPADQARALLALLDFLGIGAVSAFVGASYGGMVGMHFAHFAPQRCGALLAINAAHRTHPFVHAQRALQRQAIELGERLGDASAGVSLARKIAMLSYRTPAEFERRFRDCPQLRGGRVTSAAETYLDEQGERHARRMGAAAYRRLSESIDLHDIAPGAIAVKAIFAGTPDDRLIPLDDVRALATGAPDACFATLPGGFGHDSFLKEQAAVAGLLSSFLSDNKVQR